MVKTLNAALVLAKMQHPNACDILEVQMEIKRDSCRIFHVLEALDSDLERDIEGRRSSNRPYAEGELRRVLRHTARVLACAHSKRIAHRDVKPSHILRTAGLYKLITSTDFSLVGTD